MDNENEAWVLRGLPPTDPRCLRSAEELAAYIEQVGFLPLFRNTIPGFSVEERTASDAWWSGDATQDPWEWRRVIASRGQIAYGKFFDRKAGFISRAWLPYFANARRDGYDFDSLVDEGRAPYRERQIMAHFVAGEERFTPELKALAGFGRDGEKNFEGVMTALQMRLYLCVKDFRQRRNRRGEPYGWSIAVYTTPEALWGYDQLAAAYDEAPEVSRARILTHVRSLYPGAPEKQLERL